MNPLDVICMWLPLSMAGVIFFYWLIRITARAICRSYFEEKNRSVSVTHNPTKESE